MKTMVRTAAPALTREHRAQLERIPEGRLRELASIEMAYLSLPPERAGEYVDRVLYSTLPERLRDALNALPSADVTVEASDNLTKVTVRLPRR